MAPEPNELKQTILQFATLREIMEELISRKYDAVAILTMTHEGDDDVTEFIFKGGRIRSLGMASELIDMIHSRPFLNDPDDEDEDDALGS